MTNYGTFKEIQMNMDMAEFQRSENLDNDYEIKSSFPVEVEYHLRHLIEYRIKLLLKDRVVIEPGESKLVKTACILPKRLPNLSIHLKGNKELPLAFESDGYISPKFKGRLSVKLTNYTKNQIHLYEAVTVGYCFLQPFALS